MNMELKGGIGLGPPSPPLSSSSSSLSSLAGRGSVLAFLLTEEKRGLRRGNQKSPLLNSGIDSTTTIYGFSLLNSDKPHSAR